MHRLAAACTLFLLLMGCGGGDDEGEGRTVTVDSGSTLRVDGREYSFDPSRVVVEGRGGLTVELDNAGSLAHNLRIERGGRDVGGTATLPEGRTGSARVRLAPGTYEMVCTVGDHAELGMRGELEVR
jgi:plastocyanin